MAARSMALPDGVTRLASGFASKTPPPGGFEHTGTRLIWKSPNREAAFSDDRKRKPAGNRPTGARSQWVRVSAVLPSDGESSNQVTVRPEFMAKSRSSATLDRAVIWRGFSVARNKAAE